MRAAERPDKSTYYPAGSAAHDAASVCASITDELHRGHIPKGQGQCYDDDGDVA